jgi:hypothetical protein
MSGKKSLSASAADRWINCPGSIGLIERINPPREESAYAAEGTKAHKFCEDYILGKKDLWEMSDATPEMIDGCELYGSLVESLKHSKGRVLIETKLTIPYDDVARGTADCVIVNPDILHVIDYKFGMSPVEVDNNPQLLFYGLGAYFAQTKAVQKKIENVAIHICQPRAHHWEGPIRYTSLPTAKLLEWGENTLKPAMEACRKDDAPFCSGDWCGFCPVFIHCPLNGRLPASQEFVEDAPAELPEPKGLPMERIVGILTHGDRVIKWIKAVEQHAYALATSGTTVPGYKLVSGRGSRRWADEDAVRARFGDKIMTCPQPELISPAQAEKLKLDIAEFVLKLPGNPTLVPTSDKRPPLKLTAQEDFANG